SSTGVIQIPGGNWSALHSPSDQPFWRSARPKPASCRLMRIASLTRKTRKPPDGTMRVLRPVPEKVGQCLVMGVDRQERILLTRLFRQGIKRSATSGIRDAPKNASPSHLLCAQRLHWIEFRGAPGRQPYGKQRHGG